MNIPNEELRFVSTPISQRLFVRYEGDTYYGSGEGYAIAFARNAADEQRYLVVRTGGEDGTPVWIGQNWITTSHIIFDR